MPSRWMPFLPFWLCLLTTAFNTNDQTDATIDYGSFQDPSSNVRPRFRYWVPDASVDLEVVAGDFAKARDVGMGGLELLGYYLYGNYPHQIAEGGPVPVDWAKYGWGTEAWKNLTDVVLRATKDLGLIVDLSLGPNQGAGVPAHPDDEGIMWQLLPFNVSVPLGAYFDDILPGWGTGRFVCTILCMMCFTADANTAGLCFHWSDHKPNKRYVGSSPSMDWSRV